MMRERTSWIGVLRQLMPWVFVSLTFAGIGVMHVASRVLGVDTGYKLSTLEQENRVLTGERDRLKLELATLNSPARLEKLARESLGMAPASAGAVLAVRAPERPVPPKRVNAVDVARRDSIPHPNHR